MALVRVDVSLPFKTNLPKDVSINTFHFEVPSTPVPSGMADITAALASFYNDGGPGIADFLSDFIDRSADSVRVELYTIDDLSHPVSGPPTAVSSFTLGGPSDTSALPMEVAACLSYRSSTATVPDRRRRGRVYLGPLNHDAIHYGTGVTPPTLSDAFTLAMASAGAALAGDATLNGEGIWWAVFSRAQAQSFIIDSGWVDNEPDTQRRRGIDATARTPWST